MAGRLHALYGSLALTTMLVVPGVAPLTGALAGQGAGPIGKPVFKAPGATSLVVVAQQKAIPGGLLTPGNLSALGKNLYNYNRSGAIVALPVLLVGSAALPTIRDALKRLDALQSLEVVILGLSEGQRLTIVTGVVHTGAAVYVNSRPGVVSSVRALTRALEGATYYTPVSLTHDTGLVRRKTRGDIGSLEVAAGPLPRAVDLSASLPPVRNQGHENSCVGWAVGYYYKSFQEGREHRWDLSKPEHQFSPSFVYNKIDGGKDVGAQIPDAMDLLASQGDVPLSLFPYVDGAYDVQPPSTLTPAALPYRADRYGYLFDNQTDGPYNNDSDILKRWLARGDGVVAGLQVFDSFTNYDGGVYDGPYASDGKTPDDHAMMVVGYDDNAEGTGIGAFRVVNSWGADWGENGFAWVSYDYVRRYATEAWSMVDLNHDPTPPAVQPYANPEIAAGSGVAYQSDGQVTLRPDHTRHTYLATITFDYQRARGTELLEEHVYRVTVVVQPDDDVVVTQSYRMSDGAIVIGQVEVTTGDPPK